MADIDASFNQLQQNVNADPAVIEEARRRRNVFQAALQGEPDVTEVIFTGSIARGSQIEPIHDVDLVAIYDQGSHPDWGNAGGSAAAALEHARTQVVRLLGTDGTHQAGCVRLARPGNHALKCFLDDPNVEDAFTVDVVIGLRNADGTLKITETKTSSWIRTHPEEMNRAVKRRNDDWAYFVPLSRDLKRWNNDHNTTMVPLLIEVLAIEHLPALTRPHALASFFAAAARAIDGTILDPARISEIQPDVERAAARERLEEAADLSWRAVTAEDQQETDKAACYWNKLFGGVFPPPSGGCEEHLGTAIAATAAAAAIPRVQHRRPVRDTPQG